MATYNEMEKRIIIDKPRCNREDCFQNKCGTSCELLTSHPSQPCPFYKTQEQVDIERMEAHKKLMTSGRQDLVQKYEYNKQRRGQW